MRSRSSPPMSGPVHTRNRNTSCPSTTTSAINWSLSSTPRMLNHSFPRVEDGLPVGFEAGAEVEIPRCRVVGLVADLDARGAGLGEQVDAGGEDVAGKTSALVIVLGAHRFDEARGCLGVVPEQPVRGDVVAAVVDHQVEVGAVQRRLTKARLGVGVVPFGVDHVMRTVHRVEATATTDSPRAAG